MSTNLSERPRILLVHGAWHGAWCWQILQEKLTRRGWEVTAIDLPSVAAKGDPRLGMHEDAKVVRAAIDAIDGQTIVVAHSYGGAPVSEGAADAANVVHLIYLAAFQLDVDDSLFKMVGGKPPHWWNVDGDIVTPDMPKEIFFGDVDAVIATEAITKLLPHSLAAMQETVTASAWKTIPSTYVVCEFDNAIPVVAQEAMSTRADRVVRLAAGHSPFLSRPDDVVQIIEDAATARDSLRTVQ